MARQRDPRRDQAKEIWLKSDGEKLLKDIAKEIGVSDSQIRKWKSIDKWSAELKGNVTNDKGNVTNQVGAPLGNQNAKGNKGNSRASPPKGNKNAIKTGEYETIFAEYLSDDEKDIYSTMSDDPSFIMSEEVRLLKIRQLRMLRRIQEAESGLDQSEQQILYELRGRKKVMERKGKSIEVSLPELQMTEMKEKTFRKINDILAIEEALTRISNQLTRSIKQLSELEINSKRIEVFDAQEAKLRAEVEELKGSNKGNEEANTWEEMLLEAEKELNNANE